VFSSVVKVKRLTSLLIPALKPLDPVVETLDSANCTFHWIEIYPVVSATQPLNN